MIPHLRRQCMKEEEKLLKSKGNFVDKIYFGLSKYLPSLQDLPTVRRTLIEYSPVMGVISDLQRRNTEHLITLKTGSPLEILEVITNKNLVGTSINLEVFNMRSAKSRIVSAATGVKPL